MLALVLVLLDSVVMLLSIIMTGSLVSSTSTSGITTSSALSGKVCRVHIKTMKDIDPDKESAEYLSVKTWKFQAFVGR